MLVKLVCEHCQKVVLSTLVEEAQIPQPTEPSIWHDVRHLCHEAHEAALNGQGLRFRLEVDRGG